jgi:sporulation protein YlmC with PRC-barrel domain
MTKEFLDIARQVLDRQLVDANNVPCGKVDDVEVEGGAGGELKIKALLVGNGVASDRLPELCKSISRQIFGERVVRIPWSEVSSITDHIKLTSRAEELGLGEGNSIASRIISKLPGAWKK